ncbi:MAG TPA: hypothetical protein EYP86_04685 [Candidatus Altiarchaeales archaeon]|nr:hypothetical protein [Candidatus Altiarchaeales archaeon]
MITASHYVIRNLSEVLEKKDLIEAKEAFEKFLARYENDRELKEVCDKFMLYLESRDKEVLSKIRSDLEKLKNTRRIRSQGGSGLWQRNRRPGLGHYILIT